MRLIEEAMAEVPEEEEEEEEEEPLDTATPTRHLKKKGTQVHVEVTPLPPAGKGILVSPGFRYLQELLHSRVGDR
ncbi:unnamed protein product, partial [Timema podura]|nr:unnamed protein product [Timema podura]